MGWGVSFAVKFWGKVFQDVETFGQFGGKGRGSSRRVLDISVIVNFNEKDILRKE